MLACLSYPRWTGNKNHKNCEMLTFGQDMAVDASAQP